MEILVGIAVAAVLLVGAAALIAPALKTNTQVGAIQSSGQLANELADNVRAWAGGNWSGLLSLATGTANHYYLITLKSPFTVATGTEYVLNADDNITNGLVGWWTMDEGTGTVAIDMSGDGNDGIWQGSSAYVAGEVGGYAGSFNGSNYLELPGQSSLGVSNQAYSISLWFNAASVNGGVLLHESGDSSGLSWCLPTMGFTSGGNLAVQSWDNGLVSATAPTPAPTGAWIHAGEVWNASGGLQLYVNGSLVASSSMGNYIASGASNYLWPAWGATGLSCTTGPISKANFSGAIDDIRVYNRALSPAEIQALYAMPPAAFSRYFTISDVYRDAGGNATTTSSGTSYDPSTKLVTITVAPVGAGGGGTTTVSTFVTRGMSNIFQQEDWSGGSTTSAPLAVSSSTFATSTNLDTTNAGEFGLPISWVTVPGNAMFGTSNFYVMKYEAKCTQNGMPLYSPATAYHTYANSATPCTGANGIVASVPGGYPIANISQATAASYCSSIGAHLITNNEWQTIAWNAENVASNWSGGAVGSGAIYSGHNDNAPAYALPADANDANGYAGETNTGGNQRRTLALSNGSVVWDLAGNVSEWTSDTIVGTNEPHGTAAGGYTWYQFNDPGMNYNGMTQATVGPSNSSWNYLQGVGTLYSENQTDATTYAFLRGGYWAYGTNAGIGSFDFSGQPTSISYNFGFRCARSS